jgi:hypothetical protein
MKMRLMFTSWMGKHIRFVYLFIAFHDIFLAARFLFPTDQRPIDWQYCVSRLSFLLIKDVRKLQKHLSKQNCTAPMVTLA